MYQQRIAEFDKQIEKQLQRFEAKCNEGVIEPKKEHILIRAKCLKSKKQKKKDKNHPPFDVRGYLERIHGVDVLAIPGLSETGGLELLAETGTDLSAWEKRRRVQVME